MKEYRSRSVAVLTPVLMVSLPNIYRAFDQYIKCEIWPTSNQQIFSKLSGFLASAICKSHAKNYENLFHKFWGRGGKEIFFKPHISANFGYREPKIYMPLILREGWERNFHEPHLHSEFYDPNLKNGARGTIVAIKNSNFSKGCRFRIKIQLRWLKVRRICVRNFI